MLRRSCVSAPLVVVVFATFSQRVSFANRAELETIDNQWSLALAILMVGRYRQHSRQCTSSG